MSEPIPLSALRPGEQGTIGRVDGSGPIRRRLLELGLTPGTPVTLVRLAPLRDPMEIRVRGYQLCLRRTEAAAVWMEAEPSARADETTQLVPALATAAVSTASQSVGLLLSTVGSARGLLRLLRPW
jgi:ferrous iron transport protein A